MLSNVPDYVYITFILLCGITLFFFIRLLVAPLIATAQTKSAWIIGLGIFVWLGLHSSLALQGYYTSQYIFLPRVLLMLLPPILAIVVALIFLWKSDYINRLSLKTMTNIHVFRFPLELVVFTGLASSGNIPEIMTLYGRNPDILVGITAPIIGYLYFSKKSISPRILLAWNIISLLMLINISTIAILSLPYPFQQFGLDQPNVAVINFPFIFLPCFLVALAYFCHIMSIYKILVYENNV